jgi:adenine-specific DNA-methyltransferase
MGQYFITALKPRILKAIYSKDWKDGKPISRNGISHAFKYFKIESYEDTLNNLQLQRTPEQQLALTEKAAFSENYLMHYMLDFESQDSLLDLEKFETPFNYQLEITTSSVGETTPTNIDLVETFNYLLGLHVKTICKIDGVVVVRGKTQDERKIMVLWRTVPEMDADQFDEFFQQHLAGNLDGVTDIYVNGDNNLANLRPKNQHWNVHLTEESFHQLMFEDSGA